MDGVARQLPLCAEIVGRNAGKKSRPKLFIQEKQFRVSPHVTRVRRNEKGQVTDQVYALGASMFPQPFALAEQKELGKANPLDRFRQVAPRLGQGRGFA